MLQRHGFPVSATRRYLQHQNQHEQVTFQGTSGEDHQECVVHQLAKTTTNHWKMIPSAPKCLPDLVPPSPHNAIIASLSASANLESWQVSLGVCEIIYTFEALEEILGCHEDDKNTFKEGLCES